MIAASSVRAIEPRPSHARRACPACRSGLHRRHEGSDCTGCGRIFPDVAGIADLRLAPDRYLSLDEDREKALRLAAMADATSFDGLARAYYAMTGDVDGRRADRYLGHVARAGERADSFIDFLPRSGRVLEIGCGSGGMVAAARRRGIAIEGVDIAARWLVLARRRTQGVACLTAANAESLPFADASFDAIFADSVLEHLGDVPAVLRECLRVAKPGGRLVLISPNRFSLLPDPHVGLWGLGWLPRRMQAGYVGRRVGCGWAVRPSSASEAARSASLAGWRIGRVEAAPAPGRGFGSRLYDSARRFPPAGGFLRRFGPLWLVEAVREGSP